MVEIIGTNSCENIDSPEYRKFRCCMCPNLHRPDNTLCPTGFLKTEITSCLFVKKYIEARGWKYQVMGGIGENSFKARYQKPGKAGWKCLNSLPWRKTFDEAQSDLNNYARLKGWVESH